MQEQRARGRYAAVELMAALIGADGAPSPIVPRDISEAGICLVSDARHEPGTKLRLRLWLDFGQQRVSEAFETVFRVVWCTPIEGFFQIGAAVADPGEESRRLLATLVHFMTKDVLQEEGGDLRFSTRH
jgi:hypothetical protein